jgi:hypothetical protein
VRRALGYHTSKTALYCEAGGRQCRDGEGQKMAQLWDFEGQPYHCWNQRKKGMKGNESKFNSKWMSDHQSQAYSIHQPLFNGQIKNTLRLNRDH